MTRHRTYEELGSPLPAGEFQVATDAIVANIEQVIEGKTATVRLATLQLYMSTVPAACRTVDVFRVTSAWTEAAITWNNQPFGTTLNNPASATATDTFAVGTPAGCANEVAGYVSGIDLTTDVVAFVAGSSTNTVASNWPERSDRLAIM